MDPNTIRGQIECLARLTGAPESFVKQVRSLFLSKGLSLDDEATPYVAALEEAFLREEMIRRGTGRAPDRIAQLREQASRLGPAQRKLREIRRSLERNSQRLQDGRKRKKRAPYRVLYSAKRRTVVTQPQRDVLPMVPGPGDSQ